MTFNDNGLYTVTLVKANKCGGPTITDTINQIICIDTSAHAQFSLDTNTGCFPLNVSALNISESLFDCDPTFIWEVSYLNPSICSSGSGQWTFTKYRFKFN